MNMNTSHNSCESCEKGAVCICGYKGCVVLVEEENPLNFIPLNNKTPITLNALGITVRDQTGQIVQYDSTSSNETECQYVYLVFDVERPKFNMRDLANLLRPRQDEVVAQQTEITKDILGK